MKNKISMLIVILIAMIFVVSSPALAQESYTIDVLTDTYIEYFNLPAEQFKSLVESYSDGRITVNIHPNEAVGTQRDNVEMVNMGEYHMSLHANEGGLSFVMPEIEVVNIPFAIDDQQVGEALWEGPYFKEVQERLAGKSNLHLLGVGKNSIRRSYFTDPIRTPDDIEEYGLTMRTMEVPMHVEIWSALGADVVTVSGPERYEAMDTGMMDGLEGGVASTRDAGLYPLIDYIVMTDHMMSFSFRFANKPWWDSLSEEDQNIIATAVDQVTWEQRGLASSATQEVLRTLPDEHPHMEILYLTEDELQKWQEIATPVALDYVSEIADEEWIELTMQRIEEAREVVEQRRQRIK